MADSEEGWEIKTRKERSRPAISFWDMLDFVAQHVGVGPTRFGNRLFRNVDGQYEFQLADGRWVVNISSSYHHIQHCLNEEKENEKEEKESKLALKEKKKEIRKAIKKAPTTKEALEIEFSIVEEVITGRMTVEDTKLCVRRSSKSKSGVQAGPEPVVSVKEPTWKFEEHPPYERVHPSPPTPVDEATRIKTENTEISRKIDKCRTILQRKDIGRKTRVENEIKLEMYRRWKRENLKKLRRLQKEDDHALLGRVVAASLMLTESYQWDLYTETLTDPDFVSEASASIAAIESYLEEIDGGKKFFIKDLKDQEKPMVRDIRGLRNIMDRFKIKYGF